MLYTVQAEPTLSAYWTLYTPNKILQSRDNVFSFSVMNSIFYFTTALGGGRRISLACSFSFQACVQTQCHRVAAVHTAHELRCLRTGGSHGAKMPLAAQQLYCSASTQSCSQEDKTWTDSSPLPRPAPRPTKELETLPTGPAEVVPPRMGSSTLTPSADQVNAFLVGEQRSLHVKERIPLC